MDTQLDTVTARYATMGLRSRGSYLVQQAGYTVGLAAARGASAAKARFNWV
jgi:hypothetical protein